MCVCVCVSRTVSVQSSTRRLCTCTRLCTCSCLGSSCWCAAPDHILQACLFVSSLQWAAHLTGDAQARVLLCPVGALSVSVCVFVCWLACVLHALFRGCRSVPFWQPVGAMALHRTNLLEQGGRQAHTAFQVTLSKPRSLSSAWQSSALH